MDINDLFDGISEAFRQYQAEMADQVRGVSKVDGFTAKLNDGL